jgi:hypothetical protein
VVVQVDILSQNLESSLSIHCVELESTYYPSICLSVRVHDNGFSGENKSIWVALDDVKKFILECEQNLETIEASLVSMSSNEFCLTLQTLNFKGHLLLKYALSRTIYRDNFPMDLTTKGGFIIDFGEVEKIIRFLRTYC